MAKIYYKRIIKGEMTIDEVPERWREEVERMLEEAENGNTEKNEGN